MFFDSHCFRILILSLIYLEVQLLLRKQESIYTWSIWSVTFVGILVNPIERRGRSKGSKG